MFPKDLLSGENVRDKSALLAEGERPHDLLRSTEDRAAVAGNSLCVQGSFDAGDGRIRPSNAVSRCSAGGWRTPPHVVLEDYPLVRDRPELAADELGRLAALGTIL